MTWTPVSKALPDKRGLYLVTNVSTLLNGKTKRSVITVVFDGVRFIDVWHVTAWMPVPEPYVGEED